MSKPWLAKVDVSQCASMSEAARLIHKAWIDHKVVHISRPQYAPTADAMRAFYDELCNAVGTLHALAEDAHIGDRMSGEQRPGTIWMEVRFEQNFQDAYRHSANAQPLHTDGSYVSAFPGATLMYCVANAAIGGETTFLNSDDIMDLIARRDPKLFQFMTNEIVPHARSGDFRAMKIADKSDGDWLMNWNYYCVDKSITGDKRALVERLFDLLTKDAEVQALIEPVKMAPGDAVLWKDDRLLHGRNGFTANYDGERFLVKCAIEVQPEKSFGRALEMA